ncbi:hypothetical protein VC83_05033 [Pseudogymnoascus destructans]|uniref:RRM domain-containing protein n=2 Tax=Pseudogymnoascus destructans TaxID=655981 RepID=L8FZ34_PSED2|nr:uncharacterized protein VC83_05033 [Pseudogymnoascus destructans]ELR06275.1 hypothetical protein GMDG_02069 [Pseudogymnoascus destructans 20631-21]OAF58521.2 hypothetical protein VC83_05033 [Pseudogymnoascus destructans]
MDRSLDDIVSERHQNKDSRGPRRGGRRNDRTEYPRDGIRKSIRDEPRDLDSEWVHDKYNDNTSSNAGRPRRYSPDRERAYAPASSKLRVDNVHYDLTESDLDGLFNRIGPVAKLELVYDRAGRSEGIAYVTYESARDASAAVREYDGANANGQPIRLVAVPSGPGGGGRRNPFDSAVLPPRSLADRITRAAGSRDRSYSPVRHSDVSGPPPPNVDRYVPGRDRSSRSPMTRRRDGRPPGARRERGDRSDRGDSRREAGGRSARRPKKTQEELDAEMEDYWGGGAKENGADKPSGAAAPAASANTTGDIEMAE